MERRRTDETPPDTQEKRRGIYLTGGGTGRRTRGRCGGKGGRGSIGEDKEIGRDQRRSLYKRKSIVAVGTLELLKKKREGRKALLWEKGKVEMFAKGSRNWGNGKLLSLILGGTKKEAGTVD